MEKGSLGTKYTDRTNPMDKHVGVMLELRDLTAAPMAPQLFGNAGLEHMEKYGAYVGVCVCACTCVPMSCLCTCRIARTSAHAGVCVSAGSSLLGLLGVPSCVRPSAASCVSCLAHRRHLCSPSCANCSVPAFSVRAGGVHPRRA
jgi:hypothetical protein